ncbi:MAG: DUF445 family protein [Peptococcaceae bacterium]|nr:DUF445 family protein [Peptococcaceae bacterium]
MVRPLGEVLQQFLPLARGKELLLPMLKENLIFYLTNYGEQQIKQVLEYPLSHWVGDYLSKAKIEKFVNALENYLLDYLEQIDVESLAAKAQAKLLKQEVEVSFSEQNLDKLQEIVVKEAVSFGGYLKEKLDLLTIDDFLAYLKGVELPEVYSEFLTNEQADLLVSKGQEVLLEHFVPMSRGSLSKLAKEKLDLLTNDEMRILVQEFMGSKLKTLNYLGAGMGSVVGLASGVGLSNVGTTWLNSSLLASGSYVAGKTFIFGALGYGTNCAAIKGLFWPYYPVAGQDWLQGIIPRQKKSFAHFMGEMVNEYVVNEEIFQQIVVDYRSEATGQIIKASDSLEINIEEALLKLGEQPLYKFYPACLGDLGSKYYPKLCQKVYDNGKEFLKSDVSLEKIVSETQIWQYFEKMLLEMNLPEFKNYWQYILNEKTTATLKEQLVQILLDKLQEEATSQKIARWSNQFFQKEYVGTAFNGQLTFWVEHNLQKMMQFFISKIMELLQEKQDIVTTAIQGSIINRLSLLQQLGYSMINGNKLVGEVVEKIITKKIPAFLSMKQNEIADVVMAFWQTKLVQLPLRELQIEITPEAVQALIKQILQQEMIHEGKKELLALLGEQFPQVSIQTLLQELQLEQELADVQKWLDQHWQEEKGELLAWCDLHCQAYGQEMWSGTKLQELFLPWAEVELTADWFEQQLAALKLEQLSLDFYENMLLKVGRKSGQEIILWQNLTTNIVALLEYCLTDDEIRTWLLRMREEIIELVVGAVFRSLEQDGAKILQEMNLSALTEEQVLAMEAEELEAMVWRFARHYLIHIQNMGWMGAVFAIPGILLTFLM